MGKKPNRVSEADLKFPALIAARSQPNGEISTTSLIEKLRELVPLNEEDEKILDGRQDDRFSQIVRNIKSHAESAGNLIYEGYFVSIDGGFKITDSGRAYLTRNGY